MSLYAFNGNFWNVTVENYLQRDSSNIKYDTHPWSNVYIPLKVEDTVDSPAGKFKNDQRSAIILEMETFLSFMSDHLNPIIPNEFINEMKDISFKDNVEEVK